MAKRNSILTRPYPLLPTLPVFQRIQRFPPFLVPDVRFVPDSHTGGVLTHVGAHLEVAGHEFPPDADEGGKRLDPEAHDEVRHLGLVGLDFDIVQSPGHLLQGLEDQGSLVVTGPAPRGGEVEDQGDVLDGGHGYEGIEFGTVPDLGEDSVTGWSAAKQGAKVIHDTESLVVPFVLDGFP